MQVRVCPNCNINVPVAQFQCPECDRDLSDILVIEVEDMGYRKRYLRCRGCDALIEIPIGMQIEDIKKCRRPGCRWRNFRDYSIDNILYEEDFEDGDEIINEDGSIVTVSKHGDDISPLEEADVHNSNDISKREKRDGTWGQDKTANNKQNKDKESTEDGISELLLTNFEDKKQIHIPRGKCVIGREGDYEAEYFLDKTRISREHIRVEVGKGNVFVTDISKNGTFINRSAIEKNSTMEIVDGDVLQLADQKFQVKICR